MTEALDKILPPPRPLANAFTGELIDRDDAQAIAAALAEIDEFIDGIYAEHRKLYRCRDDLRARLGELKPTDLPARRDQSKQQQQLERCPRCKTRLPRVVVEDA